MSQERISDQRLGEIVVTSAAPTWRESEAMARELIDLRKVIDDLITSNNSPMRCASTSTGPSLLPPRSALVGLEELYRVKAVRERGVNLE